MKQMDLNKQVPRGWKEIGGILSSGSYYKEKRVYVHCAENCSFDICVRGQMGISDAIAECLFVG